MTTYTTMFVVITTNPNHQDINNRKKMYGSVIFQSSNKTREEKCMGMHNMDPGIRSQMVIKSLVQ